MLIRLLRDARIRHRAGDVIEVTDPAELNYLLSTRTAEALRAAAAPAEIPAPEAVPAKSGAPKGSAGPKGARGATGKPPARRAK